MDKKLFDFCMDEWKKCNNCLSLVNDCINGREMSYGQREILYNLFKGINRRSFRIIKILEEARLKANEKDEVKQETE